MYGKNLIKESFEKSQEKNREMEKSSIKSINIADINLDNIPVHLILSQNIDVSSKRNDIEIKDEEECSPKTHVTSRYNQPSKPPKLAKKVLNKVNSQKTRLNM